MSARIGQSAHVGKNLKFGVRMLRKRPSFLSWSYDLSELASPSANQKNAAPPSMLIDCPVIALD